MADLNDVLETWRRVLATFSPVPTEATEEIVRRLTARPQPTGDFEWDQPIGDALSLSMAGLTPRYLPYGTPGHLTKRMPEYMAEFNERMSPDANKWLLNLLSHRKNTVGMENAPQWQTNPRLQGMYEKAYRQVK